VGAFNPNENPVNEYFPPDYCNDGMCKNAVAVVMIEVQKPSGKKMVTTFGQVCVKSSHGNITNQLNSDYTFIRWYSWCADCFFEEQDRRRVDISGQQDSQSEMEV